MNNFSFKNLRIDGLAVAVPNDAEQVMDYEKYYPDGEIEKFCVSTGIYQRYRKLHQRINSGYQDFRRNFPSR